MPLEHGTHDLRAYNLTTAPGMLRDIRVLIVGAIDFAYEPVVEQALGCTDHGLWYRCEGAWIWDPYGSLVRSVLMTAHRSQSVRDIYVVAHRDMVHHPSSVCSRTRLGPGFSSDVVRTVHYLLEYVYAVDPAQWMDSSNNNPEEAVARTVRLFRTHPLIPHGIRVQGLLLDVEDSRLLRVEM